MRVGNGINLYSKNPLFQGLNSAAMQSTQNNFLKKKSGAQNTETYSPLFNSHKHNGYDSSASSLFDSLQSYGDTIRTQRQNAKNAALAVKKLKYRFKDISSKIISCKTSVSARQVAGQAAREVLRLKREKQSDTCDSDEIDAAIVHAKAMERVARKKVRHLEEEELARVGSKGAGGVCAAEFEDDREKMKRTSDADLERHSEDTMQMSGLDRNQIENPYERTSAGAKETMGSRGAGAWTNDPAEIEITGGAWPDDLAEITGGAWLDDLAKITGGTWLDDLAEITGGAWLDDLAKITDGEWMDELSEEMSDAALSYKKDLDPSDLKMMIIKHRNKEMREIAEADSKYLKAYFAYLEKLKGDGTVPDTVKGTQSPAMGSFDMRPSCYPVETASAMTGADTAGPAVASDVSVASEAAAFVIDIAL